MRFGMSDAILPELIDDFTAAHAARVRELGYSGIFTRFTTEDPFATTEARCRRVRELLAEEGLAMFQATGYRPNLVHPDEGARGEAVRRLRRALNVAGWLGAHSIDTGPGSMSPNGPWAPDAYNWTPQAREQLVKSLRESASAAEEHGVKLNLEGHQFVTLDSAETTVEVLDAVGSPWVGIDFDPANWIGLRDIYDNGAAIERWAALLGERIGSAHVKDVVLRPDMMLHIDYCDVGDGMLDIGALLRVMEARDPDAPVIIEAVREERLADAIAVLRKHAAEQGIAVRD